MDSLVGYGSDDDDFDRFGGRPQSGGTGAGSSRRKEDDTNYDDVNMDMSEDSGSESEPELPQAAPSSSSRQSSSYSSREGRRESDDSRDQDRDRDRDKERDRERNRVRDRERHHERDRERERNDNHRERKNESSARLRAETYRNDKYGSDRSSRKDDRAPRRSQGRSEKSPDSKVPALMDLKPFNGEAPPALSKSLDARDAISPRFVDRDRRDRDKERERDRDRDSERDRDRDVERERAKERGRDKDRYNRRSEDKRSSHRRSPHRSRSRGAPYPPGGTSTSSSDRRGSPPSGDYRPSSYKVNKKLEVMEKMGLQIKTPDGSMATAQQLRAAAGESAPAASSALPSYYNPSAVNTSKILNQVQKRKLLWSNKNKSEAEEAAKWSGTRFAQDNDGKQVSKFMRLMGIKEPAAVNPEPAEKAVDPIKKQEELFQAMQAQYEVARATTHTMRGVGLGFQRGQF